MHAGPEADVRVDASPAVSKASPTNSIRVEAHGAAGQPAAADCGYDSGADSPRSNRSVCSAWDSVTGAEQSGLATPALSTAGTDGDGCLNSDQGDWADIIDVIQRWPVSNSRSSVADADVIPAAARAC